jgi:hypothetical protein
MGYFDRVEDAARAYDRQAVQIHGRLGQLTRSACAALACCAPSIHLVLRG